MWTVAKVGPWAAEDNCTAGVQVFRDRDNAIAEAVRLIAERHDGLDAMAVALDDLTYALVGVRHPDADPDTGDALLIEQCEFSD